jgi:N-acetylglutamate synthase-like GNAT family acetyltransferase
MGRVIAPDYRVSRAGADECAEVAAFLWAAWNAVDHHSQAFSSFSDEWVHDIASVEHLEKRLCSERTPIMVVRAAGAIVGAAALETEPDGTVEIAEILVHPLAEHTGVGTLLVKACLQQARRMKAKRVVTHAEDDFGRDFFLHRGFVEVDERRLERKL